MSVDCYGDFEGLTLNKSGNPGKLTFSTGGGPEVTFHPDGTVTYGAHYQPNEAAAIFWQACAHWNPLKAVVAAQAREIARLQRLLDSDA